MVETKRFLPLLVVLTVLSLFALLSWLLGLQGGKEGLRIGYVAVLSGPAATAWGFYGRDAVELAVDELNEQGFKVEVVWGDSAAKPEQGVTEFKRIAELEEPDIFIVDASGVARAVAPLADTYEKPVVFGAVAVQGITKGSNYLFRNFYLCKDSAPVLAEGAYSEGVRKVSILSANEPYAQSCNELFAKRFEQLGGEVVGDEKFSMSDTDFKTYITKIKSQDPDAVYVVGYEKWLLEIVKEMKELGLNKTILAEMVLYAPNIRGEVLKLVNPPTVFLTANDFYVYPKSPRVERFREEFIKRYNEEPPYLAAYLYDTVRLIAEASRVAEEEGVLLRDALERVSFEGVNGNLRFDEDRQTRAEMRFVKLKADGSLVIT